MEKAEGIPLETLALPLQERAEIAFKQAVRKVIEQSARLGRPVYILRDGQVVAVPAEELLKQQ
jgi:hypothetical protein